MGKPEDFDEEEFNWKESNEESQMNRDAQLPTLMEIRRAIPNHCFRPSLLRSLSFVWRDFFLILALFALMKWLETENPILWMCLVPIYIFAQGTLFWAVFVLGHDCGHGSFSRSPMANEVFGHLLHSFILVPYHPWRISHRKHHKNTGHIDNDEIFYPIRQSVLDGGGWRFFGHRSAYFFLGMAWPLYLLWGFGGRPNTVSSHFKWWDSVYFQTEHEQRQARRSVLCFLVALCALGLWAFACGFGEVLLYYIAPYFVFATWLVVVTFLHHNEPGTTWHTKEWTYVKGQLVSVDRDYGLIEPIHHDIGTHVVHHLYPAIAHYQLREADRHLREVLGDRQMRSEESNAKSFVKNFQLYAANIACPDDAETHTYPSATQ